MVSSQAGRPAVQRHQIVHGEIGAMQVHARITELFSYAYVYTLQPGQVPSGSNKNNR